MQRIWNFLTNSRNLAILGILLIVTFIVLGAHAFKLALVWTLLVLFLVFAVAGVIWWRRRRAEQAASTELGSLIEQQANDAARKATVANRAEVEALRNRIQQAVRTIKTSKLGEVSGASALYQLPWYVVIGNPAAGKSTAIINSGLQFPFADKNGKVIQGIGGTRNCDWFFTSEGILLDTAGRYSVHEEDRNEWLGFLGLLKKYRPKAPINGVIIVASVEELTNAKPEDTINLAKNLRQRMQELTEKLEVFAPVYLVFTKADMIAGFSEFFQDNNWDRDQVWGASLPFDVEGRKDAVTAFNEHFDELYEGLKEISVAHMSLARGQVMPPGLLTFPLEFMALKSSMKMFIATLFEENPFQFKPVFRGFYFTSALQKSAGSSGSRRRIEQMFGLEPEPLKQDETHLFARHGFFLRNLFSKVIFADKELVRQFVSRERNRRRQWVFGAAVLSLGLMLGLWSWSYVGNARLVANVQADLDKVVRLQQDTIELHTRLEALEILQDRLEQLQRYRDDRPWAISLGLYQGTVLESKLRDEYYAGLREVMLKPVMTTIESFLVEVNANADRLQPLTAVPAQTGVSLNSTGAGQFQDLAPTNVSDAYNALKTYLMLSDRQHLEAGHLNDQLTRFWRGWLETNRGNLPREQMIHSAEKMITFYLGHSTDANWPLGETKLALLDQTRETLRRVVRGMPARERVYADIKARASTRFAPMTVASIVGPENVAIVQGSYAVPGTFTKEAWDGYVQQAIKDAANSQSQSNDWVLNTTAQDDLTLEGSPEQIQKALAALYKSEYTQEWQRFLQGVSVAEFGNFAQAVERMNRLGDPQDSPLNKLITALYDQTAWDNPSLLNAGLQNAQRGFVEWFRQTILRQSPSGVTVNVDASKGMQVPMGPIGKEFAAVAKLMIAKDRDRTLLHDYLNLLSKVRSRFNQMSTQGDVGPSAIKLMSQTLEAGNSELAEALKFVDEQMLVGMTDSQKQTLRPMLVRPLVQAYAVVIAPAETELNRSWNALVYQPFQRSLASKYPFVSSSRVEATNTEISKVFGPDGAIAKFTNDTLGLLVVRRGDELTPRTWADLGITLTPEFQANIGPWLAVLPGASANASEAAADPQTLFQIKPLPSPGVTEYTLQIDGQQLRYRNGAAQWINFVWPGTQGDPGAKISATTYNEQVVEIVNYSGRYGLEKLVNSAQRTRKEDGVFQLSWAAGSATVSVELRIIRNAQATTASTSGATSRGFLGMQLPSSVASGAAPSQIKSATEVSR
jgi:type VI secretion system protein ImpL